ncbi:hypothetical protein JCM8097_007198 [Rhodosporidiobolus ruineniae]
MEALQREFATLALTSLGDPAQGAVQLAQRPDKGGIAGRKIQLCANLYRIKFSESPAISHYDVNISVIRDKDAPASASSSTVSINRETSIAIWDALVAANPEGLGSKLHLCAFDNRKNVFTLGKLFPNGSKTFEVALPPETETRPARRFQVKLQLAQLLDLSILEKFCAHKQAANMQDSAAVAIMALDVLMRHSSFRKDVVVAGAGRKFMSKMASTPLEEGAHVLAGLFQSVRPTTTGMVVNLDTAYSPYIMTGELRKVCDAIVGRGQAGAPAGRGGRGGFRGGRGGRGGGFGGAGATHATGPYNQQELHEIKRKLVGAKVRVTHRKDTRPFIIKGFGQPAGQHVVSISDRSEKKKPKAAKPTPGEVAAAAAQGRKLLEQREKPAQTMSVADYFMKAYKKRVDPQLQVVELRGGQYVPMECLELLHGCAIPPTELSANQASNMINVAAKPPAERRAAIDAIRRDADFGPNSRPAAWGIEVEAQMLRLDGRVLPSPKVQYAPTSKTANPNVRAGSWNLVESKFVQGRTLEHWAVAVFADPRAVPTQPLEGFFSQLTQQLTQRGMVVKNPRPRVAYQQGFEDPVVTLRNAANLVIKDLTTNPKQIPPQMIFCILQDPKRYDAIKRAAAFDLPVAVPTQVLLVTKIFNDRGVGQYCGNVALKVNAKLGGVNSTVEIRQNDLPPGFQMNKTLMLGADVTHPTGLGTARRGSDEEIPPSIAAVVASIDGGASKYAAQIREQEVRKEFITDLAAMTEHHIRTWMKNSNGSKPDTVVMFRDGVSEGQYAPVVQEEVTSIKAAFRAIDAKWNPKLTYVICAKRHNVRLFAANPNNQGDVDRTGNLPPGTVVDSTITHPFAFDFYLQAHAGLKGTAKATKYVCLLDENKFGSDHLQKLVNSLCYGFARATRSVSLVPVAYYADIVATKARSYVTDDDASTTASGVARARPRDSDHIQKQLDREFKGHKVALGGQSLWWM